MARLGVGAPVMRSALARGLGRRGPPRRSRRRWPTRGRARDERALGLEVSSAPRLVEADPADLLELVVVAAEVAAGRAP